MPRSRLSVRPLTRRSTLCSCSLASVSPVTEGFDPRLPQSVGSRPLGKDCRPKLRSRQRRSFRSERSTKRSPILWAMTLLVATWAASTVAAAELASRPSCATPQTQQEINACAAEATKDADRRLNAAYRQLLQKLDDKQEGTLQQAQHAWIHFRDMECQFEAALVGPGSMAPAVVNSCLEQLSKDRTMQLERLLNQ
jgi:uncharacterized protein YecT (DUF1311 family)